MSVRQFLVIRYIFLQLCVCDSHLNRLLTDFFQLVEPISSPGLRLQSPLSLGTGPDEKEN